MPAAPWVHCAQVTKATAWRLPPDEVDPESTDSTAPGDPKAGKPVGRAPEEGSRRPAEDGDARDEQQAALEGSGKGSRSATEDTVESEDTSSVAGGSGQANGSPPQMGSKKVSWEATTGAIAFDICGLLPASCCLP